jgi:steroid delta-isomerase-like uncharacterized protein
MAELQKTALATAAVAMNNHEAAKLAGCYAEDAVIHVAGLNDFTGRDAVATNMLEWFETFSNVRFGFQRVWSQNDIVVLEWVLNGTYTGNLFGTKGQDLPIGHLGLSVLRFDPDGKVKEEHRYGDLGAVFAQLNKKKAPPAPPIPGKPEIFASSGSADEGARLDMAKGLYAAIQTKAEGDFMSKLTDDIEYEGHLGTVKGKAEAKKFYESLIKAFPDIQFNVTGGYTAGDYAIVEYTLTGTHKGPILGMPPSNHLITVHAVDVLRVVDGKVARAQTYSNGLELMTQLGAMPPVIPPK